MSDTNSTDTTGGAMDRFLSLGALRTTHGQLLRRCHESGDSPKFLSEINRFIRLGQATGALLDDDDDRWAAQSILDYWLTILYRAEQNPADGTLAEFDPEQAPKLDDDLCPYLGLDAFALKHHKLFFGRQRLVEKLIIRLKKNRLMAVVGPSGSGKSSLVLAGLLPRMEAEARKDSQKMRCYGPMVPGSDPLASLARLVQPAGVDGPEWILHQVESFRQDPDHLSKLIGELGDVPAVLIIDQFEEVFTLCHDDKQRQTFVSNFLNLAQTTGTRHIVIFTMRSDYAEFIPRLPALQEAYEQAQVPVHALNYSELREAIEKPAESVGLKFEKGVVEKLIEDVLGAPTALPLLQFTLLKLWETRERNRVTREAYERLGGGLRALQRSADDFYNRLPTEEQQTAKHILLRLVEPGEGREVTRHRARLEELYRIGLHREWIKPVLDKLIQARLVRITEGDTTADTRVEVPHEALVRNWPTLVDWLEDKRSALRQRKHLTAAAEKWKEKGRDPGALIRGPLLDDALRLHSDDLNELENEFVRVSKEVQEEDKKEKEKQIQREVEAEKKLASEAKARQEAEEKARHEAEKRADEQRKLAREAKARQEAEEKARHEAEKRATEETRARKRMFRLALWLAGAVIVAFIFAFVAFFNWEEARRLRKMSLAEALALRAPDQQARSKEDELGALLACQAYRFCQGSRKQVINEVYDALQRTLVPECFSRILRGHIGRVWSVGLSRQNKAKVLASGSADTTIRLWDLDKGGYEPTVLRAHEDEVTSVAFSPDGKTLASGSKDKTLRLWNVEDLKATTLLNVLRDHEDEVTSVAFSPDGKTLASGSKDETVRLWNLRNLSGRIAVLHDYKNGVLSVAFNPEGTTLTSGHVNKIVRIWDLSKPSQRGQKDDVIPSAKSSVSATPALVSDEKKAAQMKRLADIVCKKVWRNLTFEEWNHFVPPDVPYERTCPKRPVHPSFVEHAQNLARRGEVKDAIKHFKRALKLDNRLVLNPETEAKKWWAQGMVEQGREKAEKGDLKGAVEEFENALRKYPDLNLKPEEEAGKWKKVGDLVEQGKKMITNKGDVDGALECFRKAKAVVPDRSLLYAKIEKAKRDSAKLLVKQGKNIIESERDVDSAIDLFKKAQKLDVDGELAGKIAKTRREQANGLFAQGRAIIVSQGDVEGGIGLFEKALKLDSEIPKEKEEVAAEALAERANNLAIGGKIELAIEIYEEAMKLDSRPENYVSLWNTLCVWGSLWEKPGDVMCFCDQAVDMDPSGGSFHSSRAVARAVKGDVYGAIEDYEKYLKWAESRQIDTTGPEEWFNVLKKDGKITDEMIEETRNHLIEMTSEQSKATSMSGRQSPVIAY